MLMTRICSMHRISKAVGIDDWLSTTCRVVLDARVLGALARLGERPRDEGGRFVDMNFDSYLLLRIHQMPQVEAVPPALATGIYYATGMQIRSMPFKSHDLGWNQR